MEPLLENAKIYVGGLPEESTDNVVRDFFEKYGRVVKVTVPMDGKTGKSKGFGFVWFADEDIAKAAVGDVEEHVILGTKVEVKEAIRRDRSPTQDDEREACSNCERINALRHSKKIFVGGLPPDLTEEEFKAIFEAYGRTIDVVIIVDSVTRVSRGFGFVTYESEESARAVLRTSRYIIHDKEVEVKVAIPKEMTKQPPSLHSQHHPSAFVNWYHHNFGMIRGLPFVYPAPIYPYASSMVPYTAALYGYNGYASNEYRVAPTPIPFTKVRISKPPGIDKNSSSAASAEGPPVSDESNLDGGQSPAGVEDGKNEPSSSANGQNGS